MSIASSDYPEITGKIVSWVESAGSLGMIGGPLVGAFIFYFAGFSVTFFVYSCVFFVTTPVYWILLGPDRPYIHKEQNEPIRLGAIVSKPLIGMQMIMFFIG